MKMKPTGSRPSLDIHQGALRPEELSEFGRSIFGATLPSEALLCERSSSLSAAEVEEVVERIARGREERHSEELPQRLWTRNWDSVTQVVFGLDERASAKGVCWKVGAASEAVDAKVL